MRTRSLMNARNRSAVGSRVFSAGFPGAGGIRARLDLYPIPVKQVFYRCFRKMVEQVFAMDC